MPRIRKSLPASRADYSFGDLLYWHLFIHGTRATGDPEAEIGWEWEPGGFADLLGISDRTLRYWIADKHFPENTVAIAQVLFGDNPRFDAWKRELAEALRTTRARKLRKSSENGSAEASGQPDAETIDTNAAATPQSSIAGGDRDDRTGKQRSRSTALVPYSPDWNHDERRGTTGTIHPVWFTRPSREEKQFWSRRPSGALVSGIVILIGLYAWTRPSPEPASKMPTPAPVSPEPKPAPIPPPQETKATPEAPKPEPTKVEPPRPAPEAPQKVEAPKPEAPTAPPLPAPVDPQQAAAAAAKAAEQRRQAIAARQAVHDAEVRAAEDAARKRDADPDPEATAANDAQDRRGKDARAVAGMGYRLMENTSAVSGASYRPILVENATACAEACARENCDAFTFSGAPHTGTANYCYRYKSPIEYRAEASSRTGKRIPDAASSPPRATGALASAAPIVTAQAAPAPPADDKPDGLTRCANGPVKVTGFRLACDSLLGGGTTLGSAQLRYTVSNINECAAKCRPIQRCVGFTYNAADPDGQHSCEIFGPVPEQRTVNGYISGMR